MNEYIKEMAKCCPFYENGECYVEAQFPSECDLMCQMFGFMANLEAAGYRKQGDGDMCKNGSDREV